ASGFVCPVLPVFPILEPRPAPEETVLFRMLIIESVRYCRVTPVIGLAGIEIVVERFEVGAGRRIIRRRFEFRVSLVCRIDDAARGQDIACDWISHIVACSARIGPHREWIEQLIPRDVDWEQIREVAAPLLKRGHGVVERVLGGLAVYESVIAEKE